MFKKGISLYDLVYRMARPTPETVAKELIERPQRHRGLKGYLQSVLAREFLKVQRGQMSISILMFVTVLREVLVDFPEFLAQVADEVHGELEGLEEQATSEFRLFEDLADEEEVES